MTELNNKSKFSKLAEEWKKDIQKIYFLNTYQEAFVPDKTDVIFSIKGNVSKEIDNAFYVYSNKKRMTEDELNELKALTWKNYPTNLKYFFLTFVFWIRTEWTLT